MTVNSMELLTSVERNRWEMLEHFESIFQPVFRIDTTFHKVKTTFLFTHFDFLLAVSLEAMIQIYMCEVGGRPSVARSRLIAALSYL